MKIALYGATGMIGQRILAEALSRGHEVTAIARNPSKITVQNANLHVVASDISDSDKVAVAVAGQDAVISAFAPPHDNAGAVAEAYHSLFEGLRKGSVKRVLIVGGAASLEVAPGITLLESGHLPEAWAPIANAHGNLLKSLPTVAGDLDWTYFSPAGFIQPGERTGKFRLGTNELVTDSEGNSKISAEDYAIAAVDEIEQPKHVRRRFTVGY